ncbi:hypothetical protein FNV65_37180 [Streptomyces sp. S1A1-8]|uniref:hypothetical protein n=1 Tax=unclassified Streptomyces TaxID=2593676 RepID=UPI001162BD28|nr:MULTISPECIES: hypothetical protein [unclassified Streptomyces]QDO01119.1 hypothetical protein FNV58_38600 [Streptomyces sp. RLB1-9]QDO22849.1 hypothetical protein FNV65_37180 [Streptomyces sp. S1A1-8]QDO32976.1 hypothetical protein FNV63_37200 [Streptomyces sp. S1A1-3]
MKCIVAGHEAVTAAEFAELAFGIDLELFTGPAVESAEERAVRLAVAREVLAELRESDREAAAYAEALLRTSPLKDARAAARRPRRTSARRTVRRHVAVTAVAA